MDGQSKRRYEYIVLEIDIEEDVAVYKEVKGPNGL